jgi:hypothetical protein
MQGLLSRLVGQGTLACGLGTNRVLLQQLVLVYYLGVSVFLLCFLEGRPALHKQPLFLLVLDVDAFYALFD